MLSGAKVVLSERKYLAGVIVLAIALSFTYMLAVPVLTTPGNDLAFALSVLTPVVVATDILISAGTAVLLAMTVYLFKQVRTAKAAGGGAAGASAFSGIVASVTCPACATTILGFLGASGTIFFATYRNFFALIGLAIIGVAIYAVSRSISKGCESCQVPAAMIAK